MNQIFFEILIGIGYTISQLIQSGEFLFVLGTSMLRWKPCSRIRGVSPTYSDLYFKEFDNLNIETCGVKVHTPELFKENFLLDLASLEKPIRDKSVDYIKKTIEISHNIFNASNQSTNLDLVINVGGHSSDTFLNSDVKSKLFENLLASFEKIDFGLCNPLIQSMPPYPWHLGGRRYHNLFVKRVIFTGIETNFNFCIDFPTHF